MRTDDQVTDYQALAYEICDLMEKYKLDYPQSIAALMDILLVLISYRGTSKELLLAAVSEAWDVIEPVSDRVKAQLENIHLH